MGQLGFFDVSDRYAGLDAKNDPLLRIDELVPWERFRERLEEVWRQPERAAQIQSRSQTLGCNCDV